MRQWRVMLAALLALGLLAGTGCDDDDDKDTTTDAAAADAGTTGGDTTGGGADAGDGSGDGAAAPADPDPAAPAAPAALTAPGLLAPADNSQWLARTGTYTITLAWNPVDGAESYLVVVNGTERTVNGTSYKFTGGIGSYEWRVAAVRGTEEAWSGARQFTFYVM